MRNKLTQPQRLIAAGTNILLFFVVTLLMGVNFSTFFSQGTDESIWFYSGFFLLIMATFVTEPYFTAPTDTLANSIGMVLMLFTIQDRSRFIYFGALMAYALTMFVVSIVSMCVRQRYPRINSVLYKVTANIGSSKFMYSAVYILSAISYFKADNAKLIVALFVWICMICLDLTGKGVILVNSLIHVSKTIYDHCDIGTAVKCKSPKLYTAEIEKNATNLRLFCNDKIDQLVMIRADEACYHIGLVTTCKVLVDKLWIEMMLLEDKDGFLEVPKETILINGQSVILRNDIGSVRLASISELSDIQKERLLATAQYCERACLAGFVLEDSNVNTIRFSVLQSAERRLASGTVVSTFIKGEEVLYQVFDGVTAQVKNDGDNGSGFVYAIARKLGHYNHEKAALESNRWLPNMSEPVYLAKCNNPDEGRLKEIALNSIGYLPGTDMRIPLVDIDALVTHNTAILGILGVGKSCLSFELIKRMVDAGIKVICIDITNQYISGDTGLPNYIDIGKIRNGLPQEEITRILDRNHTGAPQSEIGWGNVGSFTTVLDNYMCQFCASDVPVLVLNPNEFDVTKGRKIGYNIGIADVSIVGITNIITESVFKYYSQLGLSDNARCCIVYEEAHSLIPEWSSVVEDGDAAYCNGTARIILQGRKFGLGCLAITQRTANISKSILNQCNTMFAMRAFDDTSKGFLENYIGKEYVNTLSQLEERHAIIVGRGMRLKQPVIVRLNDKSYVQKQGAVT